MKTIINFLFYNTICAFLFSLIELLLHPAPEAFHVSSFPLFIFIFANYFIITLILTLLFSAISFLLFRSSRAMILKFKINALFYTYELRTVFIIRTFALLGYLLVVGGLIFLFAISKLKGKPYPSEWRFFYLFTYSGSVIIFSLLGNKLNSYLGEKLKEAPWISYRLYLILNITFITTLLTTLIVILYGGYALKIFYLVQFFMLLLLNTMMLLWFVISDHHKYFFHKLTVITLALLFFINGFSIFEKKEINLKNTLFILNQAHFLSEKINSRILKTYFDRDRDGFYSFFGYGDCNDHNNKINPLATDIPDNNIDEDCNGSDAKSFLSDPLSREDYHRFRLEYPHKTLILVTKNYPSLQKKKNRSTQDPHTLLLSQLILPTPDYHKNLNFLLRPDDKIDLSSTIKQVKKIPESPLPGTLYLHYTSPKKIEPLFKKLIQQELFTQIYLIPLSLTGSGKLGYYGTNQALFQDQINSFALVWSEKHTYRSPLHHPISLKNLSRIFNNLHPAQKQYQDPLTNPIFFNGSLPEGKRPIISRRYSRFGDLLEQSIILNQKQCIYYLHNHTLSCFNFNLPPQTVKITNHEKRNLLFHLKKDRKQQ